MAIAFWVFLFSLITGFASILLAFFIYLKYRKIAVLFYIFFLFSLFLIILYFFFHNFGGVATHLGTMPDDPFVLLIQYIGSYAFIVVAPFFYHYILGLEIGRGKKIFFFLADTVVLAATVVYYITRLPAIGFGILIPSLALTILYGLVLIAIHFRRIPDRGLKNSVRTFLIVTACFFPLILADMFDSAILGITLFPMGFFALPAYYLVINILSIIFTMFYFNKPPYLQKGKLTGYLTGQYSITGREAEIILLLLDGSSNREIGEKLFISYKTVENHIYNIYQKTGVKNRIELFNLILSNR
ncbi:MAG: hypothetical protein A2Y33_03445 [Spirochaetes bacterium GWF1_51_8]|nr:MAG: hypothetical protein A2Y33_03445 [Spirochaetes bacterium GWF1_51_8]